LTYLASKEGAIFNGKLSKNAPPIRLDAMDDPFFNDPATWPGTAILKDLAAQDKLWPRPMAGRMSDIMDSTENALYEYFNNNIDFNTAIERGNKELDRLLGR
jgi:ABC-type glycerol-3-phosphate transport system substrate-binding protein